MYRLWGQLFTLAVQTPIHELGGIMYSEAEPQLKAKRLEPLLHLMVSEGKVALLRL